MDVEIKHETSPVHAAHTNRNSKAQNRNRRRSKDDQDQKRRKCVSTACIACRRRKSKCDGAQPACAACVSVYNTECIYDPSSDHRRKGVYKKDIDSLKTRNSTLQTLIQAILNYPEDEVPELVAKIRSCESLDKVAESIMDQEKESDPAEDSPRVAADDHSAILNNNPTFESRLASKVGELRLDHGAMRMLGGTSNLLFLEDDTGEEDKSTPLSTYHNLGDPVTSWTNVTSDRLLILHLLNHYFTWHYTFFTILPKEAFLRHFYLGMPQGKAHRKPEFCTSLLVNAILALGCHFTSAPTARANPGDPDTAGDHFFQEAKRQIYEQEELETPRLATVQALALMSVREAGCGRESRGWVYSGMAFRMACDLGLSFHSSSLSSVKLSRRSTNEEEEDARRITFWGCFIIDKCWSQYLGRLPMFQLSTNTTIPKFDVFPSEDSDKWSPYFDSGFSEANSQPSRSRTVALQISTLCEISSDLIRYFYHPQQIEKPVSKQQEMKHLSDIHSRLEEWKRELPKELEPKEGTLSSILIMHMMFQILYIHLFRPFLKYNQDTSPLPSHVSPRRLCTQAAGTISKLLRLYKRSHGLRQIVNVAVYICHSACTIHLLNLPEKTAKRDITHGVKHLEEIADGWICARRTLCVLSAQAQKWNVELPEDAASVLSRSDSKYGRLSTSPTKSPELDNSALATGSALNQFQNQSMPVSNDDFAIYDNDQSSFQVGAKSVEAMVAAQHHFAPPIQFGHLPRNDTLPSRAPESYMASTTPITDQSYLTPQRSKNPSPETQSQAQALNGSVSSKMSADIEVEPKSRKRKEAEMFGGVEALLREGQDWWLNDQAFVASGFSNWTYGADNNRAQQQNQNEPLEESSANGDMPSDQNLGLDTRVIDPHYTSSSASGPNSRKFSIENPLNASVPDFSNTTQEVGGHYRQNEGNPSEVNRFGTYTNLNEASWYE